MSVCYSELGAREFRAAIGELVGVYAAAMNPPERLIGGREAIMDRHAASPPSAIAPAPYAVVRSVARREGRNRSRGGSGVVTTSSYTGTDRRLSRPGSPSNAPPLECQTQGVASNSSANELDFSANLCSNVTVFE